MKTERVLYYKTMGAGPPVVLIPGMAAQHSSWGLQFGYLKKHFQIIAIDNRGTGKSHGEIRGLTIEDMASDIDALIHIVNVPKIHLVGFSMGGMVALEYALRRPENVTSIVLSSLPIEQPPENLSALMKDLSVPLQNGTSEGIFEVLSSYLFSNSFLNDRRFEVMTELVGKAPTDYHPETILCQLNAIQKWIALRKWEQGCKHPCLMIFGSEDKLIPIGVALRAASDIFPNAIKKVVENSGHAVHIEKSDEFNSLVCDFLRSPGRSI